MAERLAELSEQQTRWRDLADGMAAKVGRLRQTLAEIESRTAELRRRLDISRATASVQRAESLLLGDSDSGMVALSEAETTLARIGFGQEQREARLAALTKLSTEDADGTLDSELRCAGLLPSRQANAEAILARLREDTMKQIEQA